MKIKKILPFFIFLNQLVAASGTEILNEKEIECALEEEFSQVIMPIKGSIPLWMDGVLVRNGPIQVKIAGQQLQHWFDGPAMLHQFTFHEGSVSYTNRFLRSIAYHQIFHEKSFDYPLQFASGPVPSFFTRIWDFLYPSQLKTINNANINVWKYDQDYVALTELPYPVKFDLKTLETLGNFEYQDDLSKGPNWESAHPHFDYIRKESINYLIDYGFESDYVFYRIKKDSSRREVICKVPVKHPSYMHSFAMTKHYLILTEFPFVVDPIHFLLQGKPFIEHFRWDPERGTRFIVIDREQGQVIAKIQAPPFFAFHHVNAYEQDAEIILDMVICPDAYIIKGIAQEKIQQPEKYQQTLMRYCLSLSQKTITSTKVFDKFLEFPRINPQYDGRYYQFMYGVDPRQEAHLNELRPLYKINMQDRNVSVWAESDCYCGEPVFVPSPDAKDEDDGMILSIIRNTLKKQAFLLILDAKTLNEIGRAELPLLIPADLHGQYFDSN